MSRNFFCDTFALKIDYASLIKQPAISYNLGKDEFMATIELYKDKINSMSNYIEQAKNAVSDFCVDLSALKSKILGINSSVCDNVVSSISSSSQTQEQQIAGLEATQKQVNAFIDLTINRDNSAADAVSKAKDDFYKEYSYLKPECEKSGWEKFCDGLKKVGDWCKEHWKEIVLAIELIAAVACLFIPGLQGIGVGILLGALKGAITGGLIGGITSLLSGGSFLEGFAQGALDGAIMGGALGGVGGIAGKFITCGSKLGNAIQTTAKVSGAMSNTMDGFDTLAMGLGMIDPDNPLTALNNKLHQSDLYNNFQMDVSLVSSFTGAASQNMACFIAGTTILTATGLVAIEKLAAGDKVISTNPDTLETAEKTVLETYVRQVDKLVHITINGEEIVTTDNHPFYVQGRGFIEAGHLLVGDKLVSVNGEDLIIEDYYLELTEEPVSVYNFQVEDFHTYFVGDCAVWVHNAECKVSPSRREHILEGEGPNDPGHGPNRGFGNSAFPDTWTDDYAIKAVENVANSPNSTWQQSTGPGGGRNAPVTIGGPDANAPLTTRNGRPVRFVVEGRNHGLDVRVIVEPGGEGIVTGFPINR
mgnify:CR=1 FL=1